MSDHPRVTVVMPVFNAVSHLEAAVHSVLSQTFGDLELLIVDDGSTDGSDALARQLAAADSRIRCLRSEGRGSATARNTGITRSDTEYIATMDADDVCLPHRLAEQVAYLDTHTEVLAVGMQAELLGIRGPSGRLTHYPTDGDAIREALKGWSPFVHPTVMFRRAALVEAGMYDENVDAAEDYDLLSRLADMGPLGNLDSVGLRYRVHPDQVTQKNFETQTRAAKRVRSGDGTLEPHEIEAARIGRAWLNLVAKNYEAAASLAGLGELTNRSHRSRAHMVRAIASLRLGRPIQSIVHGAIAVFADARVALGTIRSYIRR